MKVRRVEETCQRIIRSEELIERVLDVNMDMIMIHCVIAASRTRTDDQMLRDRVSVGPLMEKQRVSQVL